MARTRAPAAAAVSSVRASPRKRKQVVYNEEDISSENESNTATIPPVVHSTDSRPTKRSRTEDTSTKSNGHSALPVNKSTNRKKDNPKADEEDVLITSSVWKPKQSTKQKAKDDLTPVRTKTTVDIEVEEKPNGGLKVETKKVTVEQGEETDEDKPKKIVRKRKTKAEKEAEAMPLAARTTGLKMYVGAHVSIAKGLENAINNSLHIGGNAFALFLKSQRKWDNPGLKDENRDAFKQHCQHHHYDQSSHVVPHGSYLVNLASPDKDMAKKSYDAFVDDLHRCEALGIKYYNFHPGSTNKEPLNEAIGRLAGNLNRALAETKTVVPLLENMAGRGSVIGSRFSDLRDIIAGIKPEYKHRIGICIDTCHTFAAGYDLRTPDAYRKTFQELDDTVGLKYLKAMHINDSKAPLESHRDLHQNIGVGFLGLRAFHNVMNDPRLENIPLVLETPCDRPDPENPKRTIDDKNTWAREIKMLESLIGMDPESEEFKQLEAELSQQGKAERVKMEQSIATRDEKARKKAQKELEKGQKTLSAVFGGKGTKRKGSVSSSGLSDEDSDS